jgi:hypothetical protein
MEIGLCVFSGHVTCMKMAGRNRFFATGQQNNQQQEK